MVHMEPCLDLWSRKVSKDMESENCSNNFQNNWGALHKLVLIILVHLTSGEPYNRAALRRGFIAHNEHVRSIVPQHNLLDYEVSEGWEPLCKFLGKSGPDGPFPCVNEGSQMVDRMKVLLFIKALQGFTVPAIVALVSWVIWRSRSWMVYLGWEKFLVLVSFLFTSLRSILSSYEGGCQPIETYSWTWDTVSEPTTFSPQGWFLSTSTMRHTLLWRLSCNKDPERRLRNGTTMIRDSLGQPMRVVKRWDNQWEVEATERLWRREYIGTLDSLGGSVCSKHSI